VEYRCLHTRTREVIFQQGPFANGTNNVGEFLAIVHALAFCQQKGLTLPIYSDSYNAILWVSQKKCNTRLARDGSNEELFALIERAERWLQQNEYENEVLKWETEAWGEIPADYGRK
jgi:ribonuclease HI